MGALKLIKTNRICSRRRILNFGTWPGDDKERHFFLQLPQWVTHTHYSLTHTPQRVRNPNPKEAQGATTVLGTGG